MTMQLSAAASGPEGKGRVISVLEGGCDLSYFLCARESRSVVARVAVTHSPPAQVSLEEKSCRQGRGRRRPAQSEGSAVRWCVRLPIRRLLLNLFVKLSRRVAVSLISPRSAAKKSGANLATSAIDAYDADASTWAAVEATHGSLAACTLAHVQALAAAAAQAAAKCGSSHDAGRGI